MFAEKQADLKARLKAETEVNNAKAAELAKKKADAIAATIEAAAAAVVTEAPAEEPTTEAVAE